MRAMQKRFFFLAAAAVMLLTACGKSPEPGSAPPPSQQSSSEEGAPHYSDAAFVERAHAMGYSDRLLTLCLESGHTRESILRPPLSFVYDVSADGQWTLYQGATPDGGMLLGMEQVCLQNNATGEVRVLGADLTDQRVLHANIGFCADDQVSYLDTYGGAVYDLAGNALLTLTLDPEAMGYFIFAPAYHPVTDTVVGLGVDYKTGNSVLQGEEAANQTFALVILSSAGEVLGADPTPIPMEVNGYGQVLAPTTALLRGDSLWVTMTTLALDYPFYRIDLALGPTVHPATSDDFHRALPHADNKG